MSKAAYNLGKRHATEGQPMNMANVPAANESNYRAGWYGVNVKG